MMDPKNILAALRVAHTPSHHFMWNTNLFGGGSGSASSRASSAAARRLQKSSLRRQVDAPVMVTTLAGTGSAGFADGAATTAAQFYNPSGVAIDGEGGVIVADSNNHRIRRISADGQVTTLAGTGSRGFADGAATTAAQFNDPAGVAIDGEGGVIVADLNNQRIRRISAGLAPPSFGSPYLAAANLPPADTAWALAAEARAKRAGTEFWFLDASLIRDASPADDNTPLPSFQSLRASSSTASMLTRIAIDLAGAIGGEYREAYAAVSHRWERPDQPDPTGTQRRAIREMLRERPRIRYVWIDVSQRAARPHTHTHAHPLIRTPMPTRTHLHSILFLHINPHPPRIPFCSCCTPLL